STILPNTNYLADIPKHRLELEHNRSAGTLPDIQVFQALASLLPVYRVSTVAIMIKVPKEISGKGS
ncbi:hypothetical protein OFM52_32210, partial [Escherichia coli]|nr:hypothetical protein [Escherichia coli]